MKFDYKLAFSRNLGWLTKQEQEILRNKRIAIAGMGGGGGEYVITLTRLGLGKFNISDLDAFEVGNFNRQAGAFMHTVGIEKVRAMEEQALSINPELDINVFDTGINEENIPAFLKDVDLYVDALDVFTVDIRIKIFDYCHKNKIPAITAIPMGMGVAALAFMPGKMTFEEYFRVKGKDQMEQTLRLVAGISPAKWHVNYIAAHDEIDVQNHKVPSTPMGLKLCAGVLGTMALKILLKRGEVRVAPRGMHFDAYRHKFMRTWLPWGNNNPIQKLLLSFMRKRFITKSENKDLPLKPKALNHHKHLKKMA